MKLRIPRDVKVGDKVYTVHYSPGEFIVDKDRCHGLCDTATRRISLNSEQPPDMLQLTFLHELTHAILWESGHKRLFRNEALVDHISTLLHGALFK